MKSLTLRLFFPFSLATAVLLAPACTKHAAPAATSSESTATKHYPLTGVVVSVTSDPAALMVKHEAIPDYMPAMTMPFKVAPSVLTQIKPGDVITATLIPRGEELWLEDVRHATTRSQPPL